MAEVAPGMSKIFVRYRNTKPSADEVREIFSKHGTITDVKLYAKFCFVEYDSEVAAELAVAAENGAAFKDVKLEVETVVRNVEKRKSDASVAEASASTTTEVPASKSEEVPSADNAVKKFKQEVFPADSALTKDSCANEAAEVKAAVASENAQGDQGFQQQADISEDVSVSSVAPHLGAELNPKRRRYRVRKHNSKTINALRALQEKMYPAECDYRVQSKSNERDTLPSTAHADHSLSASYGHSDQPLNSCGPSTAHPNYVPPESVPPVDYNQLAAVDYDQYSSTTYNWSGYPPAEQTYTTAYPPADSWSYPSNYTAECSQVNSCRPETSYYGSRDADARSVKPDGRPVLAKRKRSWDDTRVIQEGYSVRGDPSIPGKADRPDLPDLVNYSPVQSVAKASASDLKARDSRDPTYGSSLESRKTPSLSQGATKSAQVVTSVAESQGREKTDSAIEHSGVCELIITEPNLRQYGLKVASKIHSTGLKVEICNLPPGMTVIEEVEDALIRGLLFAVVITERHVEHNSVTVDVLHGVAEEHRNMVLDDAVRLIATSYQDYLTAKRASAKSSAAAESSQDMADDVVPNERTQKLIIALARNQQLTYEEIDEIIIYLRKRQEALKKESIVLDSLPGQNTVAPQQQIESVDVELQRKLEATIFGILKGEAPAQQQGTRTKPTHSGSYLPAGHYADPAQQQATSTKQTHPGSYLPAGHYADPAQQQATSTIPTHSGSYLPTGHYANPAQQQATSTIPTHSGSYLPTGHYIDSGDPYASNDYRRY